MGDDGRVPGDGVDWDLQPHLSGERLLLRPLREDDREALTAAAADPAIWEVHPAWDRYKSEVFRGYFDEGIASRGTLIAIDRADGSVVGSSRYSTQFTEPGELEIGWTFLVRSHWGGASNREMKRLMLSHAFGFVDRVIFRVGDTNGRSRRAMEKVGGILTDRMHVTMLGDREVRHVVYAITASDFWSSPLAAAPEVEDDAGTAAGPGIVDAAPATRVPRSGS